MNNNSQLTKQRTNKQVNSDSIFHLNGKQINT